MVLVVCGKCHAAYSLRWNQRNRAWWRRQGRRERRYAILHGGCERVKLWRGRRSGWQLTRHHGDGRRGTRDTEKRTILHDGVGRSRLRGRRRGDGQSVHHHGGGRRGTRDTEKRTILHDGVGRSRLRGRRRGDGQSVHHHGGGRRGKGNTGRGKTTLYGGVSRTKLLQQRKGGMQLVRHHRGEGGPRDTGFQPIPNDWEDISLPVHGRDGGQCYCLLRCICSKVPPPLINVHHRREWGVVYDHGDWPVAATREAPGAGKRRSWWWVRCLLEPSKASKHL
jgi:hypothetical protein